MANERVIIKTIDEDAHFREIDKLQIEKLRAAAKKEAQAAYVEAHKQHCFRCGTHSLVEVEFKNIHIDICVNEGCGAVHLDPGEIEKLLEGGKGVFGKIKGSVFSAFK
jgi:flavin reductase (DIM6/NTAB) family NADH-FMN oxidoreductase RutF